ncbi:MAG: SpoIIE family protein phosphatase [Leptospiraceae bacterium]|nr:SpoIIE family protein phosphatase [Leptospiraceae bacterium]
MVPDPEVLPSGSDVRFLSSFPVAPMAHFPQYARGRSIVDFTIYIPFHMPAETLAQWKSPAAFFPGIGENFVIYLNGHELAREIHIQGGKIQIRRTELAFPVPVRRDYLKPGENLLTIYLLGEAPADGSLSPVPGLFYDSGYFLGESNDVHTSTLDTGNLVLVSLYLAFGLYFLFIFLRRPEELYGLFFFLFTLGTFGFYIFRTRLVYDLVANTEYLTRWENASIFILPGILMVFLLTYLRPDEKLPIWGYLVLGINVLCAALVLIFPFSLVGFLVDKWRLFQIPLMLWLPVFHIWSVRRGDRDAGKFTVALVLLLSAAVFDLLNSIYVFVSMEPTFRWGFFGYASLLVVIMGNRFLVSLCTAETLNVELTQARGELEEAARMRDTFTAAASHEIRTPVHGILGIARMLLNESRRGQGLSQSELQNSLELITESARRLGRLVDDFMDHSRLKEGQLQLRTTSVRLSQVVEHCFLSLEPQAGERKIELLNLVSSDLPPVEADELRLQQILLNLIGNAIKFTREGSVSVHARAVDRTLEISVKDTGIGIPEDKRERIFQPFHQADQAIARTYGGAGLGLYIVRRLVELHGGNLELESRPGRGSTFRIFLPVSDAPASEFESALERPEVNRTLQQFRLLEEVTRESASAFENQEQSPRILVVDDDTINTAVLRGILEPAGFQLIAFKNAREAIQFLQGGGRADMGILDLMLGGMSGIELCIWIRQSYSPVDLPVLILTAYGDNDHMVEGFAAGANDYLEKPVDAVELLARVRTLVDLRFSSRERSELLSYRQEIQIARKIHMELLPSSMPQKDGVHSIARYLPRGDLGGDYYDVRTTEDGVIAFLADVTGHGIAAALGAAITRVAFLLQRSRWQKPVQVLDGINAILLDAGTSQLVTAACAFLDRNQDRLYLGRAGHLPGAILRKDGQVDILFPRGRVMGWLRDLKCEMMEGEFKTGDRLILFTDGLTELRNEKEEFLGEERVWDFLKKSARMNAAELAEGFMKLIQQWQSEPQDDIALIILEATEGGLSSFARSASDSEMSDARTEYQVSTNPPS